MRLSRSALVFALFVLPACHRPGPPSQAYAHARAQFNRLYADELDDAYLDPQMDDVEAELKTVPKDSSDHADAESLLARIEKGRKDAQAEKDKLQAGVQEALAPPQMPLDASEPPDAGSTDEGPRYPEAGMSLADFQKYFGSCFKPSGQAQVSGSDAGAATLYALSESPACQQRFEYFQTRVVVADASKVLGKALKSSYQAPPDAGAAAKP